jgi:hypothetical protein
MVGGFFTQHKLADVVNKSKVGSSDHPRWQFLKSTNKQGSGGVAH